MLAAYCPVEDLVTPPIIIIADIVHRIPTFPLGKATGPALSSPHWPARRVAKGDCDTVVSRSLRRSAFEVQRLCTRCLESEGAIQASPHVLSLFWGSFHATHRGKRRPELGTASHVTVPAQNEVHSSFPPPAPRQDIRSPSQVSVLCSPSSRCEVELLLYSPARPRLLSTCLIA